MSMVQHGFPKFEYFQKSQAEMSFSCSCTQDINIISKDYIAIFQDNKILQESIFRKISDFLQIMFYSKILIQLL